MKFSSQVMPIGTLNSGIVEASNKLSYVIKVDKKLEFNRETGEVLVKPNIFCDSFMDDPQNFAYLKLTREERKNISNVSQFNTSKMLLNGLRSDTIFSTKLGLRVNHHWVPDSISHCVSAHITSQFKTNF